MDRKIILYIAISLDGFIADQKGCVNWLGGHDSNYQGDYGYGEFTETIDTVVMGMSTYLQIKNDLSPSEWPYPTMKSYVFTHQKLNHTADVEFISEDIVRFIKDLKKQPGKAIWISGGASIANQLVQANLIDEYQLSIMPIILGSGIRLFTENNPTTKLHLERITPINGVINTVYTRNQ